jgi:hypothetical protein
MSIRANIGQLIVSIIGDTRQFDGPVKESGKNIKRFEKELESAKRGVGHFNKMFAAIGVGFSAGALASKFKSTAESLDQLAKTSQKIGIDPEKLSALQFAGEQTGVAVDTVSMALMKMSIRAAEAAKGGGEAVNVLKEMKIDANKFAQLKPDQQFMKIVGAMQGMTSHSDKLRIAVKLFEEEGAAMVNMINQGEAGLRNLERQAQQLGRTMSGEDLANVEKFNDALNRLSTHMKSIGGRLVIDIAPRAEQWADKITEAMQGAKLGSGRDPKTGQGFMRRNFRWTFGAADWLNRNWVQPQSDKLTRQDIANKVATDREAPVIPGRRGTANRLAKEGGGFFTPTEIQRARDNLGRHRFVTDGIKQMKEGYHKFFNESVKGFFDEKDKFLKDARKSLGKWQRAAAIDILTRPKLKPPEEKEKTGPVSRSANTALIKGTVEAYQAVRANLVPKEQLAETKKQTGILSNIRDKLAESGPMMLVARI